MARAWSVRDPAGHPRPPTDRRRPARSTCSSRRRVPRAIGTDPGLAAPLAERQPEPCARVVRRPRGGRGVVRGRPLVRARGRRLGELTRPRRGAWQGLATARWRPRATAGISQVCRQRPQDAAPARHARPALADRGPSRTLEAARGPCPAVVRAHPHAAVAPRLGRTLHRRTVHGRSRIKLSLTKRVRRNGTFTFALTSRSRRTLALNSAEAFRRRAPRLVITGDVAPAPPAPGSGGGSSPPTSGGATPPRPPRPAAAGPGMRPHAPRGQRCSRTLRPPGTCGMPVSCVPTTPRRITLCPPGSNSPISARRRRSSPIRPT